MSMSTGSAIVVACRAFHLDASDVIGQATGSMDSIAYNAVHGDMAFETLLDRDPAAIIDWMMANREERRRDMMLDNITRMFGQFEG